MRIIELESFRQVQDYGTSWNDLLNASRDNHVFLTLEWLETWWKHFGAKREILLLAVANKDKILALAPLMISDYTLFGVKLKNIEFLGTPDSDYQSFIIITSALKCVKMILDYLKLQSWDCIELKNIPEESETAKALKVCHRKPLALKEKQMETCFFVPLLSRFEEFQKKLGRKQCKNIRWRENKLRKGGHKIEFGSFSQMGFTVEEAMKIFFELHQLRWQSKGYKGKFANPVFRDFHMELAKLFNKRGWLSLNFFIVDGEPVAAEYGFEYRQKHYAYLTGFSPQYSRYGVGTLTEFYTIKDCIGRGLIEYDMMRGEHTYKEKWAPLTRKTIEFDAIRWSPTAKAYEWLIKKNFVPSLSKKIRDYVLSRLINNVG